MKKVLRFCVAASTAILLLLTTAIASHAQIFTSLFDFDGTNGYGPAYGPLVQGFDGNLYGVAQEGGANGYGTVFKITPTGTLTTLYNFAATGGVYPLGLVQATDGNLYGSTGSGGKNGYGTVFKMTPSGTLTTLYSFCTRTNCDDGSSPVAGLIQGSDGSFYGTTFSGGTNNWGVVFKVTSAGKLTVLHTFDLTDGARPTGYLIQGSDGAFYGTTSYGGTNTSYGTVFKVTSSGSFTSLHSFDGADGYTPWPGVVEANDGNFYGTTNNGGTCGTLFKLTPNGTLTTFFSFDCTDGSTPVGGLIQATDDNLYGTTFFGGTNYGTVYKISLSGTLTTLHEFDNTDGDAPAAALVQATNGDFYGTTNQGGTNECSFVSCGTVFGLAVGLRPFVETLPTSGSVGSKVIVLGNGLTGTTSVTFNGTAATFTVASSTEIKTTVPTGATTGKVQVTTPHGTLTSNVVFRVK